MHFRVIFTARSTEKALELHFKKVMSTLDLAAMLDQLPRTIQKLLKNYFPSLRVIVRQTLWSILAAEQ